MGRAEGQTSPSRRLRAQRSRALQQRGYSWEQIADTWEADYPNISPRVALRWALGLSHLEVAERWNSLDVGQPTMTKSRIYEFESWPSKGRRPTVRNLRMLAHIYQTSARRLLTDDEYATYDEKARIEIDQIDYRPSLGSPMHVNTAERFRPDRNISVTHGFRGLPDASDHVSHVRQSSNLSGAFGLDEITALRSVFSAYVDADARMGSIFIVDAVRRQVHAVESACRAARGERRADALRFAIEFLEFCGWVHQDAGDFSCADKWTSRALDYAMELGDHRLISYILMRKSNIATDANEPMIGLGLANAALSNPDSLTPRLRSVILRQRANAHAALISSSVADAKESGFGQDSESAMSEAVAGASQDENDPAPYCTLSYVEMEIGASLLLIGKPKAALPVFEASKSEWPDPVQSRDNALCLARLATAHACVSDLESAYQAAVQAIAASESVGSWRIASQLGALSKHLGKWSTEPLIADLLDRLRTLVGSHVAPPKLKGSG